jgi:predicted transposase/invertase (TIGR01784 family)
MFKMIFGDSRDIGILTDFLQAALDLPAEDYEEVTLVDPHLARESPDDKMGVLDVKVKTRSGKLIDVEIVRREVAQIIVSQRGADSPRRDLIFRYQ